MSEESEQYIGFVDTSEHRIGTRPRGYVWTLVLDSINSEGIPENLNGAWPEHSKTALMRIRFKSSQYKKFFNDAPPLVAGDWVIFKISKEPSEQPVEMVDLAPNEEPRIRKYYLNTIKQLSDEPQAQSLSAAVSNPHNTSSYFKKLFDLRRLTNRPEQTAQAILNQATHITSATVYDVGQASFSRLELNNGRACFFDVGEPINWLKSTWPRSLRNLPKPQKDDFVIVSHWDWDHFAHGKWKKNGFYECYWIAPAQSVGPGAARFAKILNDNRKLVLLNRICPVGQQSWRNFRNGNGSAIHLLKPPYDCRDLNASGIFAFVRSSPGKGTSLLTGDCHYNMIRITFFKACRDRLPKLHSVVIPHHGGILPGQAPRIKANGLGYIVSYGKETNYGHPDQNIINNHYRVFRKVSGTADNSDNHRFHMEVSARQNLDII